jgi:hypothetical protein
LSGSVTTILLDGELTPVWQSKRNADTADAGSLEKAEKRVAVKNLEEPKVIYVIIPFLIFVLRKT